MTKTIFYYGIKIYKRIFVNDENSKNLKQGIYIIISTNGFRTLYNIMNFLILKYYIKYVCCYPMADYRNSNTSRMYF